MKRQGDTVTPFSPKQSWDLLLQLLGEDWQKDEREGRIDSTEVAAAKSLLDKLAGLALAIQQAAICIKNPEVGGTSIAGTLSLFNERIRDLPDRHGKPRNESEKSLDALWDISFSSLSRNARDLLVCTLPYPSLYNPTILASNTVI